MSSSPMDKKPILVNHYGLQIIGSSIYRRTVERTMTMVTMTLPGTYANMIRDISPCRRKSFYKRKIAGQNSRQKNELILPSYILEL
jgi:hypothetical protein